MERLSETQYWFVMAVVLLTPMLTFWIIDIIDWVLRRTVWRRPEMLTQSGPKRPATNRPALPAHQGEPDGLLTTSVLDRQRRGICVAS